MNLMVSSIICNHCCFRSFNTMSVMCMLVQLFFVSFVFAESEDELSSQLAGSKPFIMKKVQCNLCGRRFKTPAVMQMHKKLCHRTDTMRRIVGRTTSSTAGMSSEAGQTKDEHLCSVCGRQFQLHQSLVAHMATHTGECPPAVRGCTKWFGSSVSTSITLDEGTFSVSFPSGDCLG